MNITFKLTSCFALPVYNWFERGYAWSDGAKLRCNYKLTLTSFDAKKVVYPTVFAAECGVGEELLLGHIPELGSDIKITKFLQPEGLESAPFDEDEEGTLHPYLALNDGTKLEAPLTAIKMAIHASAWIYEIPEDSLVPRTQMMGGVTLPKLNKAGFAIYDLGEKVDFLRDAAAWRKEIIKPKARPEEFRSFMVLSGATKLRPKLTKEMLRK